MMPGLTSKEIITAIRKNRKTAKIKIIFLTVVRFAEMTQKGLMGGNVVDFIEKPFNSEHLIKRIKEELDAIHPKSTVILRIAGYIDGKVSRTNESKLVSEIKALIKGKNIDIPGGISREDLPHMFERYFRAKTAEGIQGTGIGLNVVKEFVGMHGGVIDVDSIEGEGSTFTLKLPVGGNKSALS